MGQFIPNFEYFWPPAMGEAGWTIAFYGAGLDPIPANLKTVYNDQAETTPLANPLEFDIEGKVSVVLGEGGYKVVVRNPLGEIQSTKDNVSNSGGTPAGAETFYVATIDDLRNFDRYTGAVEVAGYFAAGDGGGGSFRWDEDSTATDDGGYAISPASLPVTGRWLRIPDEDGMVRAASFGALGTSAARTAEMTNASIYAATNDLVLSINEPVKLGTMTILPRWVNFGPDGRIRPDGTATVTFRGVVQAPYWRIFDTTGGTLNIVFSSDQVSNPYWFGGAPSTSYWAGSAAGNAAAFARWKAAGGGFFILPPGNWPHTGTFTPSSTKPTRFDGVVLNGNGPTGQIYDGAYYPGAYSLLHVGHVETGRVEFSNGYALSGSGNDILSSTNLLATGDFKASNGGVGRRSTSIPFRMGGNIDFLVSGAYTGVSFGTAPTLVYEKVIPANYLSQDGDRLEIDFRALTSGVTSEVGTAYAYLGGVGLTPSIFNYFSQVGFDSGHATRLSISRVSATSALASWVSANPYNSSDLLNNDFVNYVAVNGPTALPGSGFASSLTLQIWATRGDAAYAYMDYLSLDFKPKGGT